MAEQAGGAVNGVGSSAGNATGVPLGTMTSVVQGGLNNVMDSGKSFLDRWFPPEQRESLKNKLIKFATEKPQLASFLLANIALSSIPLGLFFVMTLSVGVFALVAGILVGVLGAALFIVFAAGTALIVLLPVLFFTTTAASFIWLWGIGTYYIVKWFNKEPVPGIHKPMEQGMMDQTGLKDSLPALNGDLSGQNSRQEPQPDKKEEDKEPQNNGSDTEQKESRPLPIKQAVTSGTAQVQGDVAGVRKKAGATGTKG